jgi:hypothetical protein
MQGTGETERISLERLKFDHEAQRRAEVERAEAANRAPPALVAEIQRSAQKTVEEMRLVTDRQVSDLQGRIEKMEARHAAETKELQADIRARDDESRRLRDEIVKVKSEAAQAAIRTETDAIARVRQEHDAALRRAIEANQERLGEASRRYSDDMARQQAELGRREADFNRERQSLRDETERRVAATEKAYDQRIGDLVRQYDRELATTRDQRDRDVSTARQIEQSQVTVKTETFNVRTAALETEAARLRSESEALRRENDAMRAKMHKDPAEFIRETKNNAAELCGMVEKSAVAEAETPAAQPETIGQAVAMGVKDLIAGAPELLKQGVDAFSRAREDAIARRQAQAQQAQGQQPQQPGGRRQQPQRRPALGPPQGWMGLPPAHVGPPIAINVAAPPPQTSSPEPGQPVAVPQQPLPQGVPPPAAPPAVAAAPAQQPPSQAPPPEPPTLDAEGQARMEQFIEQLDIAATQAPPAEFAAGFVQHVGAPIATILLNQFTPEAILAHAEARGRQGPLVTRSGRQYVKQVFVEAAKILHQEKQ